MLDRTLVLFLFPLRLACGYFLLALGLRKVLAGWLTAPLLSERLMPLVARFSPSEIEHNGALRVLMRGLGHVQSHPQIYGGLLAGGELVCGSALVLGLLSRPCALFGLLVSMASCLLSARSLGQLAGSSSQLILVAAFLALTAVPSGRVLGLDRVLRSKISTWPE